MLDDESTSRRVNETAQSTCGKPIARSDSAWACRKARHLSSRKPLGETRWAQGILRMVPAPILCPSRHSSPWIRTTPRYGSPWRARRSGRQVRRPAADAPQTRGLCHFLNTMRRCRRSSVPGGDDSVATQRLRQDPAQRREPSPIGLVDRRLRVGPTQHGDSLPQDQYLGVLRRRVPGQ